MTEIEALTRTIALLESSSDIKAKFAIDIGIFKQKLASAKNYKYRLGVMGVTSSGKSTMLNALLGEKLLPSVARPSSSQLVSCSHGTERKATIYFESKPPLLITGPALNEAVISRYGDEVKSASNKEGVKQIEIETPKLPFADSLLLVDSPGLDAYGLEKHEALTMETLLPTIDLCLFVTTCKSNSDGKMASVLDAVAEHDIPILIVQNMLDSVKPSTDGKQTKKMVATESKRRVEGVIASSKIKDKASALVIQISAKQACEALKTGNKALLAESNYSLLVEKINSTFNFIYPYIEARRVSAVKKSVDRFILEISKELSHSENGNVVENFFEYQNLPKEIDCKYRETQSKIEIATKNLKDSVEKILGNRFDEKTFEKIESLVNACSDQLLSIIRNYNQWLRDVCVRLGVESSSVTNFQLNFNVAGKLELKQETYTVRVKQSGFGGKFKRLLGSINPFGGDDWGYEERQRTGIDVKGSLERAKNYLARSVVTFEKVCKKWNDVAELVKNNLLNKIAAEKAAYEIRKKNALSNEAAKNILIKLKAFSSSLASQKIEKITDVKRSDSDLKEECLTSIELSDKSINVCKGSKKYLREIQRATVQTILKYSPAKNNVVVGWDANSISFFLNRAFGVLPDWSLGSVMKFSDSLSACRLGNKTKLKLNGISKNVFVLLNMLQSGSALSQLSQCGIMPSARKEDKIFFVFQDFDEVIAADAVTESLEEIEHFSQKLGVNRRPIILFNSSNPIYNLMITEIQLIYKSCLLHREETDILRDLNNCFYSLLNSETEKVFREISRHFSKVNSREGTVPKKSSIIVQVDAVAKSVMQQIENDLVKDMASKQDVEDIMARLDKIEKTLASLKA